MKYERYPHATPPPPPKFIPPPSGILSSSRGEPRRPAPSVSAQLAQLVQACQVMPDEILDHLREKGQGTYTSLRAAPEAVLASVVRAWPDVVAGIAEARMTICNSTQNPNHL